MRPESELSMAKIVDIISTLQDAIISLQSSVKMLLDEHNKNAFEDNLKEEIGTRELEENRINNG